MIALAMADKELQIFFDLFLKEVGVQFTKQV